MYLPNHFKIDDWSIVERVIVESPFVDILGLHDGRIIVSKNPVVYKKSKIFEFHLANGNPLNRVIDNSGTLDLLISGPHRYISPSWYKVKPSVPTWNYVAIQISLLCERVNDSNWLENHQRELVEKFENNGWKNDLPNEFNEKLNSMISGVVGKVNGFEAKFKLGQNRSDEDFSGVYHALLAENPNDEMAKIMLELFPGKITRK